MPKVKIELLAPFSELTEEPVFALNFKGPTRMKDVIDRIEKRVPGFMKKLLDEGVLKPGITVLKDGININRDNLLSQVVDDCDLVFCILVSGG